MSQARTASRANLYREYKSQVPKGARKAITFAIWRLTR